MPLSREEILTLLLMPATRRLAIQMVYAAGLRPLYIVEVMEEHLGVPDHTTRDDLAAVMKDFDPQEEEKGFPDLIVTLAKASLTPEAVSYSEEAATLCAEIIEAYIARDELMAFAEGGAAAAAKLQMIDDFSFDPEVFWLGILQSILDTHAAQLREEENEAVATTRNELKEFILGSSIVSVGDHREKIRLTKDDVDELAVSMVKKGQVPEGDA